MDQNKLEIFNSNIIKWYPFKKEKSIIQIGLNENITKELIKVCKKVKTISEENIAEIKEKYDYVLIYGYERKSINIPQLVQILNDDGKLIIIGKNEFGISNWSKYETVLSLEEDSAKKNTIKNIKQSLQESNLTNVNIYFVFPNYQTAEIIINEKAKIEKSYIEKYCPDIKENELKIFDENKVLKNILTNNPEMIQFFANSYLIEASKQNIDTKVKLISYNNCRKEQYRLITIIEDEVVKKVPVSSEARRQINNMKKIIEDIKKTGIELLDYEKNGVIYSKFIKDYKTLDEILNKNYNNLDNIVIILEELKTMLLKNAINYIECEKKVDLRGQDKELIKNLHFMKNAFWDMIPKNCFYIDNKYVFFDQEWEEEYLPVEFIIYRSVLNSYDLVRRIKVDDLLEKLGILEYKEYFQKIDEELRNKIIDEELYKEIYVKNVRAVDNLVNEKKIAENCLEQIKDDNSKKQKYIEELETDNRNKQKHIESLEEDCQKKQEYIKLLEEKVNKKSFWKGK